MDALTPERKRPTHEEAPSDFLDTLRNLLPGVEFEESTELHEARTVIVEALQEAQNPATLELAWTEYSRITEQVVDSKTDADAKARAKLQIAAMVHKALLFREAGDVERCADYLSGAEEYAYNMYFDEMAAVIGAEIDTLTRGIGE